MGLIVCVFNSMQVEGLQPSCSLQGKTQLIQGADMHDLCEPTLSRPKLLLTGCIDECHSDHLII